MQLDGKTILFQGDSITDMARGRSTWDQNHLYGHSFVFLIASKFGYEFPERHITIYNRGNSGDRCSDVYKRWKEDSLDLKPDIINLLVGINDIILDVDSGNGVSAEEYTDIVSRIIEDTRKELPDVRFILCEPFTHIESANEKYKETLLQRVPQHQNAIRKIAEKYDCIFVPLQEDFDMAYKSYPEINDEYWIWDGIHPTAAGHQIIAKKWLKCVEEAVR